jgi:DNA-binding winged helix-turn-helix (wHTH) protein
MRDEKNTKSSEILAFGEFRYDRSNNQLTDSNGEIVHMRRQFADVLSLLAQNTGDIVSKDNLIESV